MACSGDTSERQQTEAALRAAQQYLELALSASGAGLWDWDFRSGRTQYSPSWRKLLGYSEAEVGDSFQEWMKVIHPGDVARLQTYVHQYLRNPSVPYEIEFRVLRKDATYRWVLSRATLVRDADGRPERLLGLHVDITERKRAEEQRRNMERRFRRLIDANIIGIVIADIHGTVTEANDVFLEMLGYRREELPISWNELTPPEWRHLDERAITELKEHGVATRWQKEFIRKDGTRVPVLLGMALPDGQAEDCVAFVVDLTAQQGEAAVSAALARVGQGLITALGSPTLLEQLCQLTTEVLACECSHTVLEQGQGDAYKVVAAHGYSAEQLERMRAVELPYELLRDVLARLDRMEVCQDSPSDLPEAVQKGRRQLGITAELTMALRRGGKVIGVHSASYRGRQKPFSPLQERIARGIAHLASLALEDFRLVEQLERANHLKSDFVATMSHELRTPLSALLGYNDLLREEAFGPLLPAQLDVLQRMDSSARELLELINATLDLSRLETGQVSLQLEDVVPAELMHDIQAEMQGMCEKKPQVSARWDVAPGLPRLRTDRAKTKVVLKNLISNAVKFTDQGHVAIGVTACDGGIEFTVGDMGIGIAPDMLPIIFEPFRQAHSAGTQRRAGVGLGLYIVRRLLSLIGGRISVHSQPGCGSTFRVCLPLPPGGRLPDPPEGAFGPGQ